MQPESVKTTCKKCGASFEADPASSSVKCPFCDSTMENTKGAENQKILSKIADLERISAIVWIVLGIILVCACFTMIAGIWNIVAGVHNLKRVSRIRAGDSSIPKEYEENITSLVIIGVVNVLLGGIIGAFFVGFDFYIRDTVLKNKHLFVTKNTEGKP